MGSSEKPDGHAAGLPAPGAAGDLLAQLASTPDAKSPQAARAVDELVGMVYAQLRAIAQRQLSQERPGNTLQATALVNEAYLRLVGLERIAWQSKGHFFAAAAEAMRRVLIDHARKKNAKKRGGDWARTMTSVVDLAADDRLGDFVELDEAVQKLAIEDDRAATVVRLRFLAGLSLEETAEALGVSRSSVDRDWSYARAWLLRELERGG